MSANPIDIPVAALTAALRFVVGRELWSYDEIAAYSKFERNYVQNVICLQPGFPKAIRPVTEKGHPRYIANEVMAWFEGKKSP